MASKVDEKPLLIESSGALPSQSGIDVWKETCSKTFSVDFEDEKALQKMTESYSEIHGVSYLDKNIVEEDEQNNTGNIPAKDADDDTTPVCEGVDPVQAFLSNERLASFLCQDESGALDAEYNSRPWSLEVETPGSCGTPENLYGCTGLVTVKGDMISFVTNDLQSKIKLSSSAGGGSFPLPQNSASEQLANISAFDITVINDIENHARHLATSVDTLIENLTGTLHSISALTVDCIETYRDAVCKTCDAVDSNIKCMYQLMAKCEELSKSLKPLHKLHEQIKDVKRLLDIFESALHSSGT